MDRSNHQVRIYPSSTLSLLLTFPNGRDKHVDWILGFDARGVLHREVGSSTASFLSEVIVRQTSPAESRLRAFGGYSRILDHTGVTLFQRINDVLIADTLVRLDTVRGLWGPIETPCNKCSFAAWTRNHVKRVAKLRTGDTKILYLTCPRCGQRGRVHGKDQVQFVTHKINEPGKAYALNLVNHYVVPLLDKLRIDFTELDIEAQDVNMG